MIELITKVILRDNVKVRNPEAGDIILIPDDILDYGSYCNIVRVREGVLRKELKPNFQNDEKLQKRLSSFGNLILNFGVIYQTRILQSIAQTYVNATGYGGWGNYDIFANIAYHLCVTSKDLEVKQLARSILEEYAGIRYSAKDLLDRLPD